MEIIHGMLAAGLHKIWWEEYFNATGTKPSIPVSHVKNVQAVIKEIILHEDAVIDYVFQDNGTINDISSSELKIFVRSRANEVLKMLEMPLLYTESDNPIAEWFYKGAKAIKIHDFFVSGTNSYRRSWKTENLSRIPYIKDDNA